MARGIEAWAADTASALHDCGEDVTLFRGSGSRSASYERLCPCLARGTYWNGVIQRHSPGSLWRFGLTSAYDLEQASFAMNLVRRLGRRFDIVHTQDPLLALALQWARRAGAVRAVTILGHGTEEPLEWLQKIEYVQHLAPHHLQEAKEAGYDREGWTAIGNFVDTEVFRPGGATAVRRELGIAENAFLVLSVAAVKRHHKRIDYLIREVAEARKHISGEVALVVAGGSTGETEELIALARSELGDAAHVILNRSRRDMPALYRAADVFVLCSLKEMMPIAVLEAIASGLPALVSTHPVVGWMVGPGGDQVEMSRPGALAEGLLAYADAGKRQRTGNAARRHAVRNFSREVIVERYLDMYRRVHETAAGRGQRG